LNTTHTFLTLTFPPEYASIHLDARNGRPSWMQSRVALGKYENHVSKAIMRVGLQKYVLFYHHEVKKGSVWLAFVYIEEKSS